MARGELKFEIESDQAFEGSGAGEMKTQAARTGF